jgi:hypothetical protein
MFEQQWDELGVDHGPDIGQRRMTRSRDGGQLGEPYDGTGPQRAHFGL